MTNIDVETVELIEPWLFGVLSGDATLVSLVGSRFISTLSPLSEGVAVPYVYFGLAGERDVHTADSLGVMDTDCYYNVKGVALGDTYTGAVLSIAKRIQRLLQGAKPTFSPDGSLTCTRSQIIQYHETVQAVSYRHLGGLYHIRCSRE